MNNTHQELITEKVAEVCNKIKLDYLLKADSLLRGMCLDKELRIVLTKTLQDTIDTVLEKQRRKLTPFMQHDLQCATEFEAGDCDCGLKEALTPNK